MPGPMPNQNSRNTSDKRPKPVRDGKEIPKAPDWLSKGAKKIFKAAASDIFQLGISASCDEQILCIYATQLDRLQAVSQIQNRDLKQERLLNDLTTSVLQLSRELGITPTARAKLRIAKAEEADELDELLDEEAGEENK